MRLEQGRLLKNRSNSAGDRETVNNNRNRAGGTRGLLTTGATALEGAMKAANGATVVEGSGRLLTT